MLRFSLSSPCEGWYMRELCIKQIPLRRRFCEGDQSLGQLVYIDYLIYRKIRFWWLHKRVRVWETEMEELTSLTMDAAPLLDEPEDEMDRDWGTTSSSAGRSNLSVDGFLSFLSFWHISFRSQGSQGSRWSGLVWFFDLTCSTIKPRTKYSRIVAIVKPVGDGIWYCVHLHGACGCDWSWSADVIIYGVVA